MKGEQVNEALISATLVSTFRKKASLTHQTNLSPSEKQALLHLTKRDDIIIKPVDKGGAVIVLSRPLYDAEAHRQLSDGRQIYAAINRHKELQFIITTFANTLDKDIVTWEGRTSNHISHPGTLTISSEKLFGQISSSPEETLRRCKQSSWQQLIELSREPLLCRQWVHTTLSSYRRLLNQQSSCEKPTKDKIKGDLFSDEKPGPIVEKLWSLFQPIFGTPMNELRHKLREKPMRYKTIQKMQNQWARIAFRRLDLVQSRWG
ncbi:hypothetical protein P5673_013544 [Acropora cervicornis]|uniref:Uncharacterized protein n=1 Tax=Acropora cervicornis TaxID=6130 RepID=A0AAD9V6U1_ACRCE|nr:hypothetical protein P5673_013544 [Acropora cervicornis]